MTEQEDKDKEKIRYKKFSVKKSEKYHTQNDEIAYIKSKGASGNVNPNNEKISYRQFKAASGNISPKASTRKTQSFQPARVLNPKGTIPSCSAPSSLSQYEKDEITKVCKMTKFYDDSQNSELNKNPSFQQLKETKLFDKYDFYGEENEDGESEIDTDTDEIEEIEDFFDELFNEDGNKIPKEVQTFVNNKMDAEDAEIEELLNVNGDLIPEEKGTGIKESTVFMSNDKSKEELQNIIFKYGESLELGILVIYYICEKFSKRYSLEKPFFSGKELNYILSKSQNFFNSIRKELLDKNFIQYYGTITKKKHSYVKIYSITKQGVDLATKIIESKKQEFSNIFNDLILRLDQRYKEYNKDLMSSENNIVIRSLEEINNDLKRIAKENKAEILTPFKSEGSEINFKCKECNKKFKDIYKNMKRRQAPIIFCPFCFPELKPNAYIPEELREEIAKHTLIELRKILLCNLVEKEILENIDSISDFAFRKIDFKRFPSLENRFQENDEFRQYFKKYIRLIVKFLIKVKLLNETKQKINITDVAKRTHDKNLISLKSWIVFSRKIIQYLRQNRDFNIRSSHHDTLPKSTQISIRNFKNLYKLIDDITITYLDKDFQTTIHIHYDGKCQGINEICPFNIDYRFLPALSYNHLLKNYRTLITRKGFEYIIPHTVLSLTFEKAVGLMQTQIGGLGLECINCHFFNHATIYNFPPIFTFLQKLFLENVNEEPQKILDNVSSLVHLYYEQEKDKDKKSENYTQAQQKAMVKDGIRKSILALVKKKFCIQFLFGNDYVCPLCQIANINDHLDSFNAHHTNLALLTIIEKIVFSKEYKTKNIDWLIENLIIQECIYICGNCHRMLGAANYRENVLTILQNHEDDKFVYDYYVKMDYEINHQRDKILDMKRKLANESIQIPNPLQLIFEKGDALERNLMCIYYICEIFSTDKDNPYFTSGELNFIINKTRSFKNFKSELINLVYIQIVENFQRIYQITPKGKEMASKLIKIKFDNFPDRFETLINVWKKRYSEYHFKMRENKYYFGKNI